MLRQGSSTISPRSKDMSSQPSGISSVETQKVIQEATNRLIVYITNNDAQEIEKELENLPDCIEIFDLRNEDGLTLLHMSAFKD